MTITSFESFNAHVHALIDLLRLSQLGGENGGVPMTAGEVRLLQEKLAAKEPEVRAAKHKLAAQVELKRLSDAVVATLTAQAAQAEQVSDEAGSYGSNRRSVLILFSCYLHAHKFVR